MPVHDPQQNDHKWWGTVTIDEHTDSEKKLKPGDECVFIKTNAESHFVIQQTYLGKVKLLSKTGDINEATKDLSSDLAARITKDYEPQGKPIIEIVEIDYERTSPLTRELIARTHDLFWNDVWLEVNKGRVRKDEIKIGRDLK